MTVVIVLATSSSTTLLEILSMFNLRYGLAMSRLSFIVSYPFLSQNRLDIISPHLLTGLVKATFAAYH